MQEIEAQREVERKQRLNKRVDKQKKPDAKAHYFSVDGNYLGGMGDGNTEIRIIDNSELIDNRQYGIDVNKIHSDVEAGLLSYGILPSRTGVEKNFELVSHMTLSQLLDLMHVMYGEQKGNEADKLAHVMYNREIYLSKWLKIEKSLVGTGMGQSPRHKFLNLRQWDYLLENGFPALTIFDYNLATLHVWYPEEFQKDPKTGKGPYGLDFLANQLNIIRKGVSASDTDGSPNYGYKDFYNLKSKGIQYLYNNSRSIEWGKDSKGQIAGLAKAIIGARAGLTTDPLPNYIGWYKKKGQTQTTWTEHKKPQIDTEEP
jgi:hypothetical protein